MIVLHNSFVNIQICLIKIIKQVSSCKIQGVIIFLHLRRNFGRSLNNFPGYKSTIHLSVSEIPKFTEGIANMTIPVGREAVLTCVVEELSNYKVGHFNDVELFNIFAINCPCHSPGIQIKQNKFIRYEVRYKFTYERDIHIS